MQITAEILKKMAPNAKSAILDDLAIYLSPTLDRYGINTPLRVAHFLSQAAHESDGFRTLKEYWGPTAAQSRYEGRKDLGNTQPGDGKLFMGRGIFQLTGRANYASYGKLLSVDLLSNPELVAGGKYSLLTACEYWKQRNINPLADHDDAVGVTKKINGGTNGLDQRIAYLKKAKSFMAEIMSAPTPAHPDDPAPIPPPPEPAVLVLAKGDKSDGVKILQISLANKLKLNITVDGDYGPATDKAVKAFQQSIGVAQDGQVTPALYAKILGS